MVRARALFFVTLLAAVLGAGVASAQTSYGPGPGASVTTAGDNSCSILSTPCEASVYPSTITVGGGASTVTADVTHPFSVTISGINAPYNSGNCSGTTSIAYLLKGPGGQFLEIMSAAGGVQQAVSNGSITIASNGSAMPYYPANWPGGATATLTGSLGSYAPGSFWAVQGASPSQDAYPSPGPGTLSAATMAASNGTGTYNSVFNGKQANGTWGLYMISDDYPSCTASFTGWTLSIYSSGTSNDTTSTTISTATANPITAAASVTFTASVANTSTSATPTGTVTFTSTPYAGGSTTTLCSNVALTGSGATVTANCATTALATEGIADINATYNPGSGFTASSTTSPYYEWVNNPTTSGGTDVFCNAGTIAGNSQTNMAPFPSVVTVSGISNAVQDVTVQVKNYTFADQGRDAVLLLKAPNGAAMVLMSALGGGTGTTTNTGSVTFSDSGAPATGANPLVGNGALTYAPTALYSTPAAFIQTLPTTPPSEEPTVPATAATRTYVGVGIPATVGTATLFSTFDGITANGTWSLFAYTDNQTLNIGGWCLAITPATGVSTTTVVSGSPNPAATGATVAITATVTSGSATPTGTVGFKDGLTNTTISGCGSVALAAGGTNSATATCNVSTLAEGDHTITATYSGDTGFNQSIGSYDQRIDDSVSTTLTGGVLTYCNTGAIKIPNQNSVGGGAAYPNPSNITVAGLFGTVNTVSVALTNFKDLRPDFLTSLLVGPGGNLDFFSGAGGDSSASTFSSLLFADSASGQVPATLGTGPYKPTSDPASGSFPPLVFSSSPFYAVPGTIHSAATNGSSTFASVFSGAAPNGSWDLFFYDHTSTLASAGNGLSGWCLNLTPHVPTFTVTETHSPASFIQSSTGQITLNVSNTSVAAVTSGGSAYPVTITDTLPNGLTFAGVSIPANDWSCSGTTTVTCTNADVVQGTDSYGQLVLNLNVSASATGGDNSPEVSEGAPGLFGTPTVLSPADHISISTTPILSVTEAHSGTFTQGQTGGTLSITVSNTGSASTAGTTTVTETLPTGFTAASFSGTGWTCSGTNAITCTSLDAVAGGSSFNEIDITVAVPSSALKSTTTNAATASGGGALADATSLTDTFAVAQVPYSMGGNSGTSPQSTAINTAFGTNLSVTVTDAGGIAVSGVNVAFTAPPSSGASGTFSDSTNTITVQTNSSGVASAGSFTANLTMGGPYTVTASSGSLTAVNFSLSNTVGAATHFSVSAPSSATSGTSFSFTVTALDAGNNTATGYTGTVHFSSSDGSATLPSNSTLTSGAGTFSATLTTAGNQTVTATDLGSSSITGTSGQINVIVLPVFGVAEGYIGTFTQGATSGTLTITVSNTAGASSVTSGTTTVTETLPTGFTAVSFSGAGWSCSGTTAITCSSTQAVNGGTSFNAIGINVAVAATAVNPTTTNAATASGGTAAASATSGTLSLAVVQVPASMAAGSGTSPQTAAVNTSFGTNLSVTVKDAANNPVPGASVTFTAPLAGATGAFSNLSNMIVVQTNSSGVASAGSFTANWTAGGPYTVTAAVAGLTTVNFSLANTAGAPSSVAANSGTTPQSAAVGTAYANPLAVTVKDIGNNPVSGVSVTFTAPASGASGAFSNSTNTITVTTNASGVASAPFTANSTVGGAYTVTAAVAGLTTVNFSLTNTAGAPTSMAANPGTTPQSAAVGTAFANPLAVTVKDAGNNPVSGVSVTFTALASGASGTFSNSTNTIAVTTNAFGVASAPFTASSTAGGPYAVTAAATGLTTVNFSLTNTAGTASHFAVTAPSSATAGVSFSFSVTAQDQYNNTAAGYTGTVHFTSTDGSATLPSDSTLTAGTGTFSATMATAGNQTLRATDTVTSSITGTSNTVAASQTSQSITFNALSNQAYGAAPFTIGATASSNLTVSFASQTAPVCTVSAATVTLVSVGTCTIRATQSGNVTYAAATPVNQSFQVTQVQPGLTVGAAPVTYGVGASVTVTVVTSLATIPTGTVTLTVDNGTGVTKTLSGGVATFSLGVLAAGIHPLSASYSGDSVYQAISAAQAAALLDDSTLVVNKAATAVALGVNGQIATATVSVTPPGAGTPTGSVQFLRGGTVLGTVPLSGLTAALPGVTPGAVTAIYSGDANFSGSTSSVGYLAGSSLTLASSANPSTLGQSVTFTASVSSVGAPSGSPTGTVQFLDGTKPLGAVTVSDGQAAYTTAMLGGGSHTIVAQYGGDSIYPAAQASYSQAVSAVTTVTLTVSPASPVYGQAVVATATVSPTTAPAGFAPPTGQVTFLVGGTAFTPGTPVGTVALASGTAAFTLTGLVAGGNEVTAEYSGDGTWLGSFRMIVVTVGQATTLQAATNTSLNLAVASGQLTLTANVTPVTPGTGSPTGSVQFVNTANSAVVATASLSDGTAVVTVPSNVAAQPIEAVYSGDANFLASTSAALPAVSSAAALLTTVFAPDELASLYGITGLNGDTTGAQPLPTSLGGATVTITDSAGMSRPAQLSAVFASASQINFAIPAGIAAGLATVTITLPGGGTLVTVIQVGSIAPGIFTANMTGQGIYAGQVVYGNPDGSQTIASAAVWDAASNRYVPNPINLGPAGEQVFLVLYGTGIRHAGALAASANGVSLPVAYFGAQSQFTGLDQVNLQVPRSLAGAGLVNLLVTVDGAPANTVTLSIE